MNILKPEYLVNEFIDSVENKDDINKIEKEILNTIIEILDDSVKFLINDEIKLYEEDIKSSFSDDKSSFFKNFDFFSNNTYEYIDELNNSKNIINILNTKEGLAKKLLMLLGKNEKNAVLMFFIRKRNDDWEIPVQAILVNEDMSYTTLDIFKSQSNKLKNNIGNKCNNDSFMNIMDSLFSLFSSLFNIFSYKKTEFLLIPPIKKNKKGKKKKYYYYKVSHIFLSSPVNDYKKNQGLNAKIQMENKRFNQSLNNIKDYLFLK